MTLNTIPSALCNLGSVHRLFYSQTQFQNGCISRLISFSLSPPTRTRFAFSSLPDTEKDIPRAAALIIGSEILTGKIQDTNTATLAKLLYSRGVDLIRVEVVPDVREEIEQGVLRLKQKVGDNGYVFTSGGIGPTHDDITYESIASAFGRGVEMHAPTVERMKEYYSKQGKELNAARLRMATLPQGSDVLFTPSLWVPLASLHNVFVFPGVPSIFTKMLMAHKEKFTGKQFTLDMLYTQTGEGDLAEALTEIARKFPSVLVGSYPATLSTDSFKTRLTFEGRAEQDVHAAVKEAMSTIQECSRVVQ